MDAETDFRTNFVRIMCENSWVWSILFGFSVVLLAVLLLSLTALEAGSEGYLITLVTIGVLVVLVGAYGVTVYRCRQYHEKKRNL